MAVQPVFAVPAFDFESPERPLEIVVIHTSIRGTRHALKTAGQCARGIAGHIRLIVPQVVPFPLQLHQPPIRSEFYAGFLRPIAEASPVETRIELRLCRDSWETLELALRPGSIVVLCGPRRWWPTRESRLARRLRKGGHQVAYIYYK